MGRNFMEMLKARWAEGKFVCVGLDSEFNKIPKHVRRDSVANTIVAFNRAIVEATHDLVCAYKPNLAFYAMFGAEGIDALWRTIHEIPAIGLGVVPVILDAKFGDIGNTNNGYVEFAFDYLGADAVTVHNYLGKEAMRPFLDKTDKGVIVLCRTSNLGAGEFQDLQVTGAKLYRLVARHIADEWNENNNCAVVVGATYPEELSEVRQIVGDMPILIPGVGFQQKDVPLEKQVEQAVLAGQNSCGQGMIVNSSRGIIFASAGEDFAEVAREETWKLHNLINQFRKGGSVC
jgi:orotidine-5'-phosphate decarboxylase